MVEAERLVVATSGPPLDYSFQELKSLKDLASHEPTTAFRIRKPKSPQPKEKTADLQTSEHPSFVRIQEIATAVRLAYNSLQTLEGLSGELSAVVHDLSVISWVDLSHNQLESIENALHSFPNLKVLYLHGNRLSRMASVLEQLSRSCPNLRKLTLFGNPIEEKRFYRWNVIHAFPQLQSLDFIRVTKRDRDLADVWCQIYKRKKQARPANLA